LSGEIAIYSDLAMRLRIPCDWGFEMGLLAELCRNASYERICEVDLGFYDHKHKDVIANGLVKTAEDSLVTLLRTLTEMDGNRGFCTFSAKPPSDVPKDGSGQNPPVPR
jgi:glucosyl-3-phosphoglycerate synthase